MKTASSPACLLSPQQTNLRPTENELATPVVRQQLQHIDSQSNAVGAQKLIAEIMLKCKGGMFRLLIVLFIQLMIFLLFQIEKLLLQIKAEAEAEKQGKKLNRIIILGNIRLVNVFNDYK